VAGNAAARGEIGVNALLRKIEERYNRIRSLKLDFTETYTGIGHAPARTESGTLLLRKPGRMRWQYAVPPGKLFLSDGREVILYNPDQRRAEKSRLKQSEDMRAPLACLLGTLDFEREFKSFTTRAEGPDTWIEAEPRNRDAAYSKVEFLAAPDGEIRRLHVAGAANAKMDFTFSNEVLNPPVSEDLFVFHAPPGVEIVTAEP
jgi:outer membrane lipoprotein carrier protein